MAPKRSGWKSKLLLLTISSLLVLAFVGLGEVYCRLFTRINFLDSSRGLFTFKKYGNSYGNTPNFEGISFGETFYTDSEGFRVDPQFRSTAPADADALLIMGDSVSFGPALSDDVTIAGWLRRAMPGTRIYNGSAVGYDSFDYKAVTEAHVERHPEIKTVALFLCLNDISDASAQLIRSQVGQASEPQVESPSIPRRVNDYLRSRSKLFLWLKNALIDTQMFYFKTDLASYQKGEQNLGDALRPIADLDKELKAKGVSLKVFICPYEAQLRVPPPDGYQLPQQMITGFLMHNGVENYDLAPDFQKAGRGSRDLFLYGDPMHVSAAGAKVAAETACSKLAGCKIQ